MNFNFLLKFILSYVFLNISITVIFKCLYFPCICFYYFFLNLLFQLMVKILFLYSILVECIILLLNAGNFV